MSQSIMIGNFSQGLSTNRLPFNIDNDAFPTMINSYCWRGRVKRKRGTVPLARLERQIELASDPNNWQLPSISLTAGSAFLPYQSISPGSLSLTVSGNVYTDANKDGTLQGLPSGSGNINYATGLLTISGGASNSVTGTFAYYPSLPVMGLKDFIPTTGLSSSANSSFPILLAFDTDYAYQINQTVSPPSFYSVSYYKVSNNPVIWSGQDYQQFWTTNYQSALWATNNKPGFNFKAISTISTGNPTTITTVTNHGLTSNDWVYFNEISGTDAALLNLKAFKVTVTTATSFTVNVTTTGTLTGGIIQLLTASVSNQDGIKFYDGDMTNHTGFPVPTTDPKGWVNFAPPLTALETSIGDLPSDKYYLVGALQIVTFKDRLLFFSPWVQSSTSQAFQLQDFVIYSWNGTPYYNSLCPSNQTFDTTAYYVDQTGKGGYTSAGVDRPIMTVAPNQDVFIVGFGGDGLKTRFVYTGNDFNPFIFYIVNSELPSSSTFSSIPLDRGVMDIGYYGVTMTDQQSSSRIDLQIPDQIFQLRAKNNGYLRVNAARDFLKEWVYFSYPYSNSQWDFPTNTFLFNYRDNTWSILYENFTAHGEYRNQQLITWASLKTFTWNEWREPWNSSTTAQLIPNIIAGTPQGFVVYKGEGTGEAPQCQIEAMSGSNPTITITSTNHCLQIDDFIYITNCLGNTQFNNQVFQVSGITDEDNFTITATFDSSGYLGLGVFAKLANFQLQTKQFPLYWEQGKQTRLGAQKYLLDRTSNGQVTLQIFLSMDAQTVWNSGSIVPTYDPEPENSGLIYSQILFTCPETDNLQTPTSANQFQIWHRVSTSLIGDTIQIGFTLSDAQMFDYELATSDFALHGINFIASPGPLLS